MKAKKEANRKKAEDDATKLKEKGAGRVSEIKEKITYWEDMLEETTEAEE